MSKEFPTWLKKKAVNTDVLLEMRAILDKLSLNTVCENARCPNQGDCFQKRTATFLIMGNICTRNCGFCNINSGNPYPLDKNEPENVAKAVRILGLKHTIITSVTRDDLEDGGASHFVNTIQAVKELNPDTTVEILIPDFRGSSSALKKVVEASPEVIGHNIETISRLYRLVRPQGNYHRSLDIITMIKDFNNKIVTKSGLMLGLGERKEEVIETITDLVRASCDILTLGQYLPPSPQHTPLSRYVTPYEFREFEYLAYSIGFLSVTSNPFVRSSYNARAMYENIVKHMDCECINRIV